MMPENLGASGDLIQQIRAVMLAAAAEFAGKPLSELVDPSDPDSPSLARPPKPEMGDLGLACFPLAKALRTNPARLAADLIIPVQSRLDRAAQAGAIPRVERVEATGPYLNLVFDPGSLAEHVCRRIAAGDAPYGAALPPTGRSTMVEYSAPNTNKPLHVGHVRNNLLGLSLCHILAAAGESVIPVNLVNDRGIHIAQSMIGYLHWGAGQTPRDAGMKGDHFVGQFYVRFQQALKEERGRLARERGLDPAAVDDETEHALDGQSPLMAEARECLRRWEDNDPEIRALWQRMNSWVYEGFDDTYARLGCVFRKWYFESETFGRGKELVEQGLARGLFARHEDGSVWAPLEEYGLKDKILLRSDGTSVYITQDLGTALIKFEDFGMDRSIYVVANEQALHFQMLFALLRLLGFPWADQCHHLSYGLVTLPHGMGKLKSREGRTVDADELLAELAGIARRKAAEGGYVKEAGASLDLLADAIGQGALKMYLLQVGAEKNIQFDPDATIDFEGDTGPAVQYSHARICSIARKGLAEGSLAADEIITRLLPQPFAGLDTGSPMKSPRSSGAAQPASAPAQDEGPPHRELARTAVGLRLSHTEAALLVTKEERALCLELARFPSTLRSAAIQLSPAPIANYLLDLTKSYARFYHNCPVLRAESGALLRARLHLSLATAATLRRGLQLLGIEAPDAM